MTDLEMKNYVRDAYPGEKWKKKVDKMPKCQIFCIYESLKKRESAKNMDKFMELTPEEQEFWGNL